MNSLQGRLLAAGGGQDGERLEQRRDAEILDCVFPEVRGVRAFHLHLIPRVVPLLLLHGVGVGLPAPDLAYLVAPEPKSVPLHVLDADVACLGVRRDHVLRDGVLGCDGEAHPRGEFIVR